MKERGKIIRSTLRLCDFAFDFNCRNQGEAFGGVAMRLSVFICDYLWLPFRSSTQRNCSRSHSGRLVVMPSAPAASSFFATSASSTVQT